VAFLLDRVRATRRRVERRIQSDGARRGDSNPDGTLDTKDLCSL